MAGRPSKLTPDVQKAICDALLLGNTRKASAGAASVGYSTFMNWLDLAHLEGASPEFVEFLEAVTRAEAQSQVRHVAVLTKAAAGYEAGWRKTSTHTIVRMKKTTLPDGSVVEEPVTLTLTETETMEKHEFDWHASLEILKRRFRADGWGDSLDLTKLDDDTLLRLLNEAADDGAEETRGGGGTPGIGDTGPNQV